MRTLSLYITSVLFAILLITSCKKMIEINGPTNQLTPNDAYADDANASAVVSGIYAQMVQQSVNENLSIRMGLYTDELRTNSRLTTNTEFFNAGLTPANTVVRNLWVSFYSMIYKANDLLENLRPATGITENTRRQLLGEALFLRAFCYFNLVNLYGDVPLVLATDVSKSAAAARAPFSKVYQQVNRDLAEAQSLMLPQYPATEKIRANRWAATALAARVHLYLGEWQAAMDAATALIVSGAYTLESSQEPVFRRESRETILQLWTQNGFTNMAASFIPQFGNPASFPLSEKLANSFDTGDKRKNAWTASAVQGGATYSYPLKYKLTVPGTGSDAEYVVVLRLAETYLVRAEAAAQLEKGQEALADLNTIRTRAGLPTLESMEKEALLEAIANERYHELFTEWGHRFFDLKRTGKAGIILSSLKPGWSPTDLHLPIPLSELTNNPQLQQNPGY